MIPKSSARFIQRSDFEYNEKHSTLCELQADPLAENEFLFLPYRPPPVFTLSHRVDLERSKLDILRDFQGFEMKI